MSSVISSSGALADSSRLVLLFTVISIIVHAALAAFAYKLDIFSTDEVDSIPAEAIHVSIVVPAPVTPPTPIKPPAPIKPPTPKPEQITKRKIISKVPSPKKTRVKPTPVKKVVKPIPPKVIPKKAASPLPIPVSKPAVFTTPQPSYQPKPKYPSLARRRGIEGSVIFDISVANDGRVTQATLIQSSGSSLLDRSASKAIKTWRFPASKFNSLSSFKQKIEFRLNKY